MRRRYTTRCRSNSGAGNRCRSPAPSSSTRHWGRAPVTAGVGVCIDPGRPLSPVYPGQEELIMLSHEDNRPPARTGPTPALGNLFRRFWQPGALSIELSEPDGAPIRLPVLGEDLRAF